MGDDQRPYGSLPHIPQWFYYLPFEQLGYGGWSASLRKFAPYSTVVLLLTLWTKVAL